MESGTTPDEIQAALSRIRHLVAVFLPRSLDGDALTTEIWIEAWQHNKPITRRFVRFRCYDLMRKELKRQHGEPPEETSSTDETQLEARDALNKLMSSAKLPPKTQRLLYLVYYRSLSLPDAAFQLKIPPSVARELHDNAIKLLRIIHEHDL